MLVEILRGEFKHEADSTRRLLEAIPDSALSYRPAEGCWTTAQLAEHIVNIYDWYAYTLHGSTFDMATYTYTRPDASSMEHIRRKFEENYAKALAAFDGVTDEQLAEGWSMKVGEKVVLPEMPRLQVARGFLFNHLYHHRGEMIVYLRATGNTVPGLYGPTREDGQRQQDA